MYRQERFGPESAAFSSRATWTTDGKGWSGILPADPQFEIVWRYRDQNVVEAPVLVSPTSDPRQVSTVPCIQSDEGTLRIYRIRPDAVRRLLGQDASDLATHGRLILGDLGGEWRGLSGLTRSSEIDAALDRISRNLAEPLAFVSSSVQMLRRHAAPRLSEIARAQGYSYEQWLRVMKRECGVSPRFLHASTRLHRASAFARLKPKLSMDEIAWCGGYADASSLARASTTLGGQTFRQLSAQFQMPD